MLWGVVFQLGSDVQLKGYEIFVSLVREYLKVMDRSPAIRRAVLDCIRQGVLKEFFEEHGSEVHNMLLSEWNLEDAIAVAREEAREEALEEGIDIGDARGIKKVFSLLRQGYSVDEAEMMLVKQKN